jgi:AraC-like DNA-binding protein
MSAIPLIRAVSATSIVRFLSAAGAPVSRTWDRAGLPIAALSDPERLVPLPALARFVDDSARTQGIDDLGLRIGAQTGVETLGMFGAAIRSAVTLGDALRTASAAVAGYNSSASYWVTLAGDRARFCRRFRDVTSTSRQIDLFTVAVMINLVRVVAGPDWTPSRIELQSAGACTLRERGVLADAAIGVGGPVTSIEVPRRLLSRRLAPLPAALAAPSAMSLTAWQRGAPPRDFMRSFEVLLAGLLESERSDVRAAADAGGLTVRSLQRRLAENGLTFSKLVDDVRSRTALSMLDQPAVKIIDVAVALGYSDAAHFTRAFRRWHSLGPLEYRRSRDAGRSAARG